MQQKNNEPKSGLTLNIDWSKLAGANSNSTTGTAQPTKITETFPVEKSPPTARMPTGVGVDTGANAADIASKSRDMYSVPQQYDDLNLHSNNQDMIVDSFTMTPEQWFKIYGYWNWNLAKNNPNGNLNNRSFGNTLRQSRIADALNNKRQWKAANIGRRTNSGFGTKEYQEGYSERWEPIETQEMRQMRYNEQMDAAARQRQINRAENIQDYPLDLQRNADQLRQQLTHYQAQTGIDFNRMVQQGVFNSEYSQSWDTYWNNLATRFVSELGLDQKDRVFNVITNLKYPFSQIYGLLHAGLQVPNPVISQAWQWLQSYSDQFQDPQLRTLAYTTGATWMMQNVMGNVMRSFSDGLNRNATNRY